MSHAARPIETAMLDRGENVRRYQHETDIACPPQLGPKRKSIRHPQFAADETFASHSSPRFLREQHRHVSLSAPKCGSVFRLHRSIPLRSDSGEVVGDRPPNAFGPPESETTTGTPEACASMTTLPKVSVVLGKAKTSAEA